MKKISFKLERETKNTYRFQEVDAGGHPVALADADIGTLYVKKRLFEGKPSYVELTVKTV